MPGQQKDDLSRYRQKRDFSKTREPPGVRAKGKGHRYLIQKHEASHLHYDFRLEHKGVLKSWAVPKGPSFDPADKRLAMEVEDHPVAYGSFEGTIPEGQYGGGTVMLWDEGQWEPIGDIDDGLAKGKLVFKLFGKRLKGEWTLVKTFRGEKGGNKWLLIKHRDAFVRAGENDAFLARENKSVVSGRTMEQIASGKSKVWESGRSSQKAAVGREGPAAKRVAAKHRVRKKLPSLARDPQETGPGSDGSVAGVRISHGGRVIYPDTGLTKLELAAYYQAVSEKLMPHVVNRPLSILRCPEGTGGACFFQRHLGFGKAKSIHEIDVKVKGSSRNYIKIDDVAGLIELIQWGVIELHPWECSAKDLDHPDRIIFDLDPDPGVTWKNLIKGAFDVKERLEAIGFQSFLKTTGGKGLHIVVPLAPKYDWRVVKAFARGIAEAMTDERPDLYIATMSKAARRGKIFIDYLRNDTTSTAVAPFSARVRPGATVSTPLFWQELKPSLKLTDFNVVTVPKRLKLQKKDPWKDYPRLRQTIPTSLLKLLKEQKA